MNYQQIEELAMESAYYTLVSHIAYAIIEGDETLIDAIKWAKENFGYGDVDFNVALGDRLPFQLNCDVTQYVQTWKQDHLDE